jgi:hypothetical protein
LIDAHWINEDINLNALFIEAFVLSDGLPAHCISTSICLIPLELELLSLPVEKDRSEFPDVTLDTLFTGGGDWLAGTPLPKACWLISTPVNTGGPELSRGVA